ncbi:MAG: rod shape-determining protein MreD [Candidatus Eiseniibacteriota bacterium]
MARGVFGLLILWTIAGLLARASAGRLLAIGGVTPDFLSLVVVYWALAGGPLAGVLAGFLVGLVGDAETGRFLGLTAGALAAVGFLVGSIGASLHRERPPAQFVVLFVATALVLALRTLFAVGGDLGSWLTAVPLTVLARSAYTAILGPILYLIARALGAPNFLAHGAAAAKPGN